MIQSLPHNNAAPTLTGEANALSIAGRVSAGATLLQHRRVSTVARLAMPQSAHTTIARHIVESPCATPAVSAGNPIPAHRRSPR